MSNEAREFGTKSGNMTLTDIGPNIHIDGFTSYVHKAEEGGYWAEVPALPGCLTQGETLDEVVDNLNDAIEGWLSVQTLDSLRAKGIAFTILPEADAAHLPRVKAIYQSAAGSRLATGTDYETSHFALLKQTGLTEAYL